MTLDEKRLKQVEYRIKNYISEGVIKSKQPVKHVEFFLTNAEDSFKSAKALYGLSTNKEYQEHTGNQGLKGYLWVINASYYSMFYMARALLAAKGIILRSDLSVHSVTFDALVYFFYLTGKLDKHFFEYYAESQEEAAELLGKRKADELIEEYFFEKDKRARFTYQIEQFAMQNKAKTSLDRAARFNREIRKMINAL
ncbi:MAG: hypothetical protein ABIA62_07555 [Candidatus Woesearchaeota archaeon]